MVRGKKEEKKTLRGMLDNLDMARTETHIEIYNLQALLKLCLNSEYTQNITSESLDWRSICNLIERSVLTADEKLDEIDEMITSCRIKADELLLPSGAR